MLIELMRAWRWLSGDIQGKANAEQTCCMSRKVLIKRAAGVPVSVATLGRIRDGLGMDEGEGCRSRNAIQRRLPACKEWKQWEGRGKFFERMDLVRRMMILTIEYGWKVGFGPSGKAYSMCGVEELECRRRWNLL